MKTFNGKAIYQPAGRAGEYAKWACNFYVGCSNDCSYCYCKKGVLSHTMGRKTATLKRCFRDKKHALQVFESELSYNIVELQKHGLFFSFTTDPMISETIWLTLMAARMAIHKYNVPVMILTKWAGWDYGLLYWIWHSWDGKVRLDWRKDIAFGFTLTGHDELEPGASTNAERIEAMRKLHDAGYKTWASIEPIIDTIDSYQVICDTNGFCDLYKIGPLSGKKYDRNELQLFVEGVINQVEFYGAKVYFKESFIKQANIKREDMPHNCVGRDYNIFKQQ